MNANQPHDRSHPITVLVEIVESPVVNAKCVWHRRLACAILVGARTSLNIHRCAVCQLIKQSNPNVVTALCVGEGQQHRLVGGMTRLCAVKSVEPCGEFLPPVVL